MSELIDCRNDLTVEMILRAIAKKDNGNIFLGVLGLITCPTSAEYQLVYDEMTNKPDADDCVLQDAMVTSWVAAGLWDTKLDRRFVMAIHTNAAGEAQLDWIDPAVNLPLLNVNGAVFTAYEGFIGNDVDAHLNTQYAPNPDGVLYTLTNCGAGMYIRNNINQNGEAPFGSGTTTNSVDTLLLTPSNAAMSATLRMNTNVPQAGAVANSQGQYIGTKLVDADQDYYKNKVKIADGADVGNTLSPFDVYLLAFNTAGAASAETAFQMASAFLGAGYTQANVDDETDIFEVYMDALGTGVIP